MTKAERERAVGSERDRAIAEAVREACREVADEEAALAYRDGRRTLPGADSLAHSISRAVIEAADRLLAIRAKRGAR